ncbi:uncharacterized protein LOC120424333 [Culex pipiens pallens]|uniref:uncharacterized protein LOC120424333 n=1 Tax=Culex pipiens pallens TaxID=42434 RepID=UPI00195458F6|nr:uncharacterized protein LOC120424333 [Culex pipiens pallens]
MWLGMVLVSVLVTVLRVSSSEATVFEVTINTKNVVNYIDKEFVSFLAEPKAVFADSINPVNEQSFQMTRSLGPMYMKVYCDSSQLELQIDGVGGADDPTLVQITPKGWRAFNEWVKQAGVLPIFVIDYEVNGGWKPKSALRMLTVANKLGIRNCLWQLGSGNITDAVQYVEDLRAFKAIVKALNFRGIVACDVNPAYAGVEQARYFNYHVDDIANAIAVSYEPIEGTSRLQQFVVQRESSSLPVWLDVKLPERRSTVGCDQMCLLEGLRYATLLGDGARNGFSAIFKSLSRQEIQSYSFNYLVALLHRASVGTKVFDATQNTPENVQLHAYCSSNGNGSLTLLAINHRPEDVELEIKLTSMQHSVEVHHFIATVRNGQILLNDQTHDFRKPLQPFAKIHPLLKGLHLTMPAFSVGFWVIPSYNARDCYDDYQDLRAGLVKADHESSVHRLLQELIAERSQQDVTQLSRRKRSVGDELADVLEDNLLKSRRTRQTKNYRRQQRVVRQKEKRTERRNLHKQKRPLRERGKRQLRRKNLNRLGALFTSRKTKRSFAAEAVDHPPMFGNSREEENNRSSFPQGDVHLLISKGPEDESFLSIEEAPVKQERPKKSRKRKTSAPRTPSQKDLRFVVPEMLMFKDSRAPRKRLSAELEASASMNSDRYLPLEGAASKKLKIDRELIEVRNIKVKEGGPVSVREEGSTTPAPEPDIIDPESFYHEPQTDSPKKQTSVVKAEVEPILDSVELVEDEVDLFTDHPELNLSMMGDEESEEHAHVEELTRRKRSIDNASGELDRIEAFFMNNTQLQQKFAEMFDMLLESFNCCGDSEVENTAREELETTTEADQQLQQLERRKRNVLLHHSQSWESRERSNILRQQRASGESQENMVPTEPLTTLKRTRYDDVETVDDKGRPGVVMLRSVTNFIKGMSTEFHRVFSHWFPKTAKE